MKTCDCSPRMAATLSKSSPLDLTIPKRKRTCEANFATWTSVFPLYSSISFSKNERSVLTSRSNLNDYLFNLYREPGCIFRRVSYASFKETMICSSLRAPFFSNSLSCLIIDMKKFMTKLFLSLLAKFYGFLSFFSSRATETSSFPDIWRNLLMNSRRSSF